MKKNQQSKSLVKILLSSFFVLLLSSFDVPDPCKPTDDEVRGYCEYSSYQTCIMTHAEGKCEGQAYSYEYNRKKL
nr:hypothetical protein [uncultured Sediminibacterium sp.]